MASWYSQCWARLQIRPEDYISVPPLTPDLATIPQDPVTKGGFIPFQAAVIPSECVVTRRSYRAGDEARIVIPYRSLPLDPRTIRQLTVQVFMGALDPEEFSRTQGTLGTPPQITLIPEVDLTTGRSNEIFRGFVDDLEVSLGDDGGFIEITCRDITGVFLDAEVQVGIVQGLPNTMRIDDVIRAIIDGDEAAAAMPQNQAIEFNRLKEQAVDEKRDARRLKGRLAAVTRALADANAQIAQSPIPPPEAPQAIAEMTEEQANLTAQLAAAEAVAARNIAATTTPARIGLPGARGIVVVNETDSPLLPMLKDVKASWNDSSKKLKKGRRGNGKEKLTYWDWITDMVVSSGYICYFRVPTEAVGGVIPPAELVIANPRTYYADGALDTHAFTHGKNTLSMKIGRSYTGNNIPSNILLKAISAKTGDHISAIFPPILKSPPNRHGAKPDGQGDRVEVQTFLMDDRIPGDDPTAVLLEMAESIYEQLCRMEMSVQIETKTLSARPSNEGKVGVVDVLDLKAGDSITVDILSTQSVGPGNTFITTFGNDVAVSPAVRAAGLAKTARLNPTLAAALVAAESSPQLQQTFRVKEVEVSFNSQEGFSFNITAMNYLDARAGVHKEL